MANCSIKQTAPVISPQPKPVSQLTEYEIVQNKIKSIPSVMECLKVGAKGFILLNKEKNGEYSLTLVLDSQLDDYSALVEDMKEVCDKMFKENPHFRCVCIFTFDFENFYRQYRFYSTEHF